MALKKARLTELKALLIGAGENGMLVAQADANEMVKLGLAEINTTVMPDANGAVPTRATAKLMSEQNIPAAQTTSTPKQNFSILGGIPVIEGHRGGTREEVYPFSQLEVGQSFVVEALPARTVDGQPVEAETPKQVVERFSSTVSSATRRYATKSPDRMRINKKGETIAVLVPTRKFTLRPVTKGQTYEGVPNFAEPSDGARVYRLA